MRSATAARGAGPGGGGGLLPHARPPRAPPIRGFVAGAWGRGRGPASPTAGAVTRVQWEGPAVGPLCSAPQEQRAGLGVQVPVVTGWAEEPEAHAAPRPPPPRVGLTHAHAARAPSKGRGGGGSSPPRPPSSGGAEFVEALKTSKTVVGRNQMALKAPETILDRPKARRKMRPNFLGGGGGGYKGGGGAGYKGGGGGCPPPSPSAAVPNCSKEPLMQPMPPPPPDAALLDGPEDRERRILRAFESTDRGGAAPAPPSSPPPRPQGPTLGRGRLPGMY